MTFISQVAILEKACIFTTIHAILDFFVLNRVIDRRSAFPTVPHHSQLYTLLSHLTFQEI